MNSQIKHLYRFGPFLLDLDERLLMRDDRVIPLSPKVFETLVALIKNNGRVIGKDELMETLWPDTFVEESNLTQNISQIRRALGDGSPDAQYIVTIPKRGYRFVAPVQEIEQGANGSFNGVAAVNGGRNHLHETEPPESEDVDFNSQPVITASPAEPSITEKAKPKRYAPLIVLLLISLGALVFAVILAIRRDNPHVKQVFLAFSPSKLTTTGKTVQAAISHDGKYAAYVTQDGDEQSLMIRQTATASSMNILTPSRIGYRGVAFSPDDNFVYYVTRPQEGRPGELHQVPVLGGASTRAMTEVDSPASFSPNGQYAAFIRLDSARKESSLIVARLDGTEERKLATHKRPEFLSVIGPAWSPDGRWIVCGAGVAADGDASIHLISINVDDGSVRRIGDETWTVMNQIAWLGDSSGVALSAWRRSTGIYGDQLWIIGHSKGESRRITNDMSSYEGVSLSADSRLLVTLRTDRVSRIWVLPAAGGFDVNRATQLQTGFGDNFSERFGLSWTPDGRMVYSTHASGNLDVWITTTDGKTQKQLTREAKSDIAPVVAPDGSAIVFASERGGGSHLWRMDLDGGGLKQLTRGKGDSWPTVSPDGRWVVYTSWNSGQPALWKTPLDGSGEPAQLSRTPLTYPVISPDGKWIACSHLDAKEKFTKVAILSFEGGEPRVIEKSPTPDFNLYDWTPDSRAIVYSATLNGVSNLWTQALEGGTPGQLTHFTSDRIFRFAWSRDGKSLACERGVSIEDAILFTSVKPEK